MSQKEQNEQARYVSDMFADVCFLPYEAWATRVRKQSEILEEAYRTTWNVMKVPSERFSSYWSFHDAWIETAKHQQRTFFHLIEDTFLRSSVR